MTIPGMILLPGWTAIQPTRGKWDIILEELKKQLCEYQKIGLDSGHDIGMVHRGLELLLGVQGYTAIREDQNHAMKRGFCYEEETDCFVCK